MLSSLRLTGSRLALAGRRASARSAARQLHTPRALPYDIDGGLEPFLSPEALHVIAVDYHSGLLERLNDLVRGTVYEGKTLGQTVIMAARSQNDVEIFNYASQAINNGFFLENLHPPKNKKPDFSMILDFPNFAEEVQRSFGSLENLKSVVSATAMGMHSSGWVWLVSDRAGNLAALPTFGAGTIMSQERMQTQGRTPVSGMGTRTTRSVQPSSTLRPGSTLLHTRSLHASATQLAVGYPVSDVRQNTSATSTNIRIGDTLDPLFCISVHEHAWMAAGLGVWGKEEYLRRFWTALDWSKILADYLPQSPLSRNK